MDDSALQRNSLATQVLEKLVQRIRGGIYPPQTQLPPENTLAAEFGVSRATIRTAMEFLAAQNLVVRRQGVGTFVSALAQIRDPLDQAVLFQTMIENNGYRAGVTFLPPRLAEPSERHIEGLRATPEDRLLQLPKVFTADGDPVIYCTNTIAPHVMSEAVRTEALENPAITEPIFDFFEKRCATRVIFYVASLRPGTAATTDLTADGFAPDTPVLTIDEIAQWSAMEEVTKRIVWSQLAARRESVATEQGGRR